MKRRLFTVILTAVVAVAMLIPASSFAGTISAPTSSAVGQTSTKWEKNFGTGWSNSPTPPALIGNSIYTGANGYVYKLNKDTGAQECRSDYLGGSFGYSMMPIVGDSKGNIYITTYDSDSNKTQIVKLDASTLKTVWQRRTSESFAGQNTCPISYIDGRLYTGTWGDDNNAGTYFCINDSDGSTVWSYKDTNGYYWAGAAKVGDWIIFGSDSGKIYSISKNADTSNIQSESIKSDDTLAIESTPTVDATTNTAYLTATDVAVNNGNRTLSSTGHIYKVNVNSITGEVRPDSHYDFGASKNKPVIYDDNIFVGDNNGKIYAFNKADISTPLWTASTPGEVKGEMLVSKSTDGSYNIYSTYNAKPGGIYYVKTDKNNSTANGEVTYIPYHAQYCISPITADSDGTMYYKNDSGYIMAVAPYQSTAAVTNLKSTSVSYSSVVLNWTGRENSTSYKVYCSNGKSWSTSGQTCKVTGLTTGKKYYFKVVAQLLGDIPLSETSSITGTALPATSKIKTSAGKKKVTISWSKVSGASGYYVYRATSLNGKYKAVKSTTARTWTNTKLKKNKYYYYKVKAYRTVSKKKITGGWSNTSYKKTK